MLGNVIHGGIKKISKALLKHRGLIAAFTLPFVFWGAIMVLWFYRAPQSIGSPSMQMNTNGLGGASIGDIALSQDVLDDDKDGLSNWEESIYGTNISNPDTDGDSYLDGEEILSGHDPLKKGPNDIYQQKKGSLTKQEQETKTATDAFAHVALLNFFNNPASQNFSSLTPEQLDSKLKESFKNDPDALAEFQKEMRNSLYAFTPIDLDKKIKVIDDSRGDQNKIIQNYAEAVAKFYKETRRNDVDMELGQLISDIFEKRDFSQTDLAISYYDTLFTKLLAIPSPESALLIHRTGLLLFYETARSVEALKTWENDPVRAFIAIKKLSSWLEKLENLDQSIKKVQESSAQ